MTREELWANAKPVPVIQSMDMVRKILAGDRTQMRQVIKPRPADMLSADAAPFKRGDILYVQEVWAVDPFAEEQPAYVYRADLLPEDRADLARTGFKWKPASKMPKAAARIFIRLEKVWCEELHDMLEALCGPDDPVVKEGFRFTSDFVAHWDNGTKKSERTLYGWNANPMVWVYNFERVLLPGQLEPEKLKEHYRHLLSSEVEHERTLRDDLRRKIASRRERVHPTLVGCYSKGVEWLYSIEQVAEFICRRGQEEDLIVTYENGCFFLDTIGTHVNQTVDLDYREKLLRVLTPMHAKIDGMVAVESKCESEGNRTVRQSTNDLISALQNADIQCKHCHNLCHDGECVFTAAAKRLEELETRLQTVRDALDETEVSV